MFSEFTREASKEIIIIEINIRKIQNSNFRTTESFLATLEVVAHQKPSETVQFWTSPPRSVKMLSGNLE